MGFCVVSLDYVAQGLYGDKANNIGNPPIDAFSVVVGSRADVSSRTMLNPET